MQQHTGNMHSHSRHCFAVAEHATDCGCAVPMLSLRLIAVPFCCGLTWIATYAATPARLGKASATSFVEIAVIQFGDPVPVLVHS